MHINRKPYSRIFALAAVLIGSCAWSASGGKSELPPQPPAPTLATSVTALPKDDVLDSIDTYSMLPRLIPPTSAWLQEESEQFAVLLKAHKTDVLVIPFEVQDRGFDRIERSLMTADFAYALARRSGAHVLDTYLAARALGEGRRRYHWPDIAQLANTVKARVLVRGYVGHDGHGKLTLTLTVQRRTSADSPWNSGRIAQRDWTGLSFSDENLPSTVVHRLQPEMLSFVGMTSIASATRQPKTIRGESLGTWPVPAAPWELVASKNEDPVSAASRFAVLAAVAPIFPERTRERLAERGLLQLENAPEDSAEARFLRSYLLHLLHRRPAAIKALGDAQRPANLGLRAALDGNLDLLETATAHSSPSLESFLLELELCYLELEYGASCDKSQLPQSRGLAQQSGAWNFLISSSLNDVSIWDVRSNAEVKSLLDESFPIPGFGLRDLARASIVLGTGSRDNGTIELSVIRHVRKIFASDSNLSVDTSEWPDRLDYLQLLEGLGESNLLKMVKRTGFMQGLTNDALQQLRTYETVYAGHPAFAALHARLLSSISADTPNQPSTALYQEIEQASFLAAYLEYGQSTTSATFLAYRGGSYSAIDILADAYLQDFPIRAWWVTANPKNPLPQLSGYIDTRDRHEIVLTALKYAETEVPGFVAEDPFLPPDDLRKLFEQRFRGSPNAAKILASIGVENTQSDAAVAYREAIRRYPATWSNYLNLGNSLLQRGDADGAASAYLSYPGFLNRDTNAGGLVAVSNDAFAAGSSLYWLGAFEAAGKLFQIAADDDDGSYASVSSIGRLALLRGDLTGYMAATYDAAQRYQNQGSYRDYLSMLHAVGLHQEAWAGFNSLAERFAEPDVWVSALVGQRMQDTTPEQLRQWLLSDPIKHANFLGKSISADYAILWSSIDREPPSELPRLLDEIQGPSRAFAGLEPPWALRRANHPRVSIGTPLRAERTLFADAYVDLRAGRYADAVHKFDELATHYSIDAAQERYLVPYFAYASAKVGDPLQLQEYLRSASVRGDFEAFLADAFFEGLHGQRSEALDSLKGAFYHRPIGETFPILSEYRYAEACEWLYKDTHDDAYRQRALEWAHIQERLRPHMAWIYTLEARLLAPGPERTRALAMALYLDPQSQVVKSLSAKVKSELTQWLSRNNPFTHQQAITSPANVTRTVPSERAPSLSADPVDSLYVAHRRKTCA